MSLVLSTTAKNAALAAIGSHLNGAGRAYVEIRSGTRPATPDTTATGTLLATVQLQTTAFGSPVSGVMTAAGLPLNGTIVASGTAAWFRIYRGNGAVVMDGDISATGDGGDLELDNLSLVAGGVAAFQTFAIGQSAS